MFSKNCLVESGNADNEDFTSITSQVLLNVPTSFNTSY